MTVELKKKKLIRSLSDDDNDYGENASKKLNSRCFKIHRFSFQILLNFFGGVEFQRTVSKFKKRIRNRCLVFTSSSKCEIRILTWWSCNDGKKCTKQRRARAHFLGANQPIAFYRSRSRCRRRLGADHLTLEGGGG